MSDINEKMDGLVKSIDTFNKEFHEKQGVMSTAVEKAAEDSAKAIDEINQIKAAETTRAENEKARDAKIEAFEKAAYRKGEGLNKGEQSHKEFNHQLSRYLKTGIEIDDEVRDLACEAVIDMKMKGLDEKQRTSEVKALQVQSNPDGGYWVLPELLGEKVARIFETSPMRQVASVMSTANESVEMIIDDNEAASGGWVSETGTRAVTDTPQIGKLTIHTHEQFAQPKATQKMIDDAGFDVSAWLNEKVAKKMTRVENTAFVSGDGASKPKGFLAYANWSAPGVYTRDALERIVSGSATDFTYGGLVDLQNSVKDEYQAGSVFMLKRAAWANVLKLKDLNDRPLINMDLLRTGADRILLGKQVIFADDMPTVSAGNEALAYGNFNEGYQVVDRIGIRVLRDQYTNKPFILFYTTKRTGGALKNYESIKIQTIST